MGLHVLLVWLKGHMYTCKEEEKIKMLQRYYAKLSLWFAIISIFVHTYLFGFTFHDIASL